MAVCAAGPPEEIVPSFRKRVSNSNKMDLIFMPLIIWIVGGVSKV